jgi:hypothetical protein
MMEQSMAIAINEMDSVMVFLGQLTLLDEAISSVVNSQEVYRVSLTECRIPFNPSIF